MGTGSRTMSASGPRPPTAPLPAVLAALLVFTSASVAAAQDVRRVLVLYPVSDGQPGILRFDESLRSALRARPDTRVEIYNEYLDSARFPDERHQRHLAEFLRGKYSGKRPDVIITALAPSLDFVLKYRDEIFPGVPVVYGAVDRREVDARKLGPGVVGVPMTVELAPTLDLALRLHPGTRRVFVVAGRSKTDAYWVGEARRAFLGHEGKVEFVYLTGLPLNDLLGRVATLPDRSVIYYLHVFEDGLGNTFVPADVVGPLSSAANAPVYGHYSTYVGRGVVGGRVVSFEAEGANAARVTARILAGEGPERIAPAGTPANPYMFDWRQLSRWGIPEGRLPRGSVVLNKPPSFWGLYRWRIIGAVVLCTAEALLIVGLLIERANRRRAEGRFRQVVAAAPNGMIMVGRDGRIALANHEAEALFGYQADELLGQPVEVLVPPPSRDRHPALRDQFFQAPASRPMGAGRELFGRRKDGTEFPVEVGLNPIRTAEGSFILASVIDITERKRAEEVMRESQSELRALTGRLLQAQETERRRIARELHDDLNQSLALIAVELDLLAQNPPGPGAPPDGRLHELSGRVKQISSAVNGLSHHLHPNKLEQLGLVAALRSLCGDLGEAHGLGIDFAADGVPASIPGDTALCLYRITQEALRNVIKHSGARHARVELSGSPDGVSLRISDDGSGFDPASAAGKGGLGLASMRERLHLVGGEIAVDARPSGGARIEVRTPLAAPAEDGWRDDGLEEGTSHRQSAGVS